MRTQSLCGPQWRLRQQGSDDWISADVPGCVHTALMAAGRISDPFVGDEEERVQWVAEADWDYCLEFTANDALRSSQRVYLVCEGLDTLATVQLNGQQIGEANNMFRCWTWTVGELLRPGTNTLDIQFRSPLRHAAQCHARRPLGCLMPQPPGAPYLRKSPYQFGWDWAPLLPPMGIWKPLRLEGQNEAQLQQVHLRQVHTERDVTLIAEIDVERWTDAAVETHLRVETPSGQVLQLAAKADAQRVALQLPIADPLLWWPNGYGEQPLYKAHVTLCSGATCLDERHYQIGLRTIELLQQDDEWGRSFTFVVNDVPIFAKGANWVPADSFPTRVTVARLEPLIRSAAEAHMNMLRVWGGGVYEDEAFYDLCDRYGLLVWQDFVFACSVYPLDDPVFVQDVEREVRQQIRRLHHRACLALWCGNNELQWLLYDGDEWSWQQWGWDSADEELKSAHRRFFSHTLPQLCNDEDPQRSYWPSSPSSGTHQDDPNGQDRGDSHYWGVWHKSAPLHAFRQQLPRFCSEFGFQSLPPKRTIARFAAPSQWRLTSYVMEHHQRSAKGNTRMLTQLADSYPLPADFDGLVYLTMVQQAEAIRTAVEHWRRQMRRTSGALYWQLNDCWPCPSWSSIDYFGRWKALHYAARRFFAPLALSVEDAGPLMHVYVVSDLHHPVAVQLHWSCELLDGQPLRSNKLDATAGALSATRLCSVDLRTVLKDEQRRQTVFVAELQLSDDDTTPPQRCVVPMVPDKQLQLVDPNLELSVSLDGNQAVFELTTQSLARFVELSVVGHDVRFSDNYIDLPAARRTLVSARLPPEWTSEQISDHLRLRSINDP